jgi:hypothetical protein
MIQFNLLPDVKIEFMKTKRLKRTITLVAATATGVCGVILAALYSVVLLAQPARLSSLDKSIKSVLSDIKSKPDINKVLTIQNQLTVIDKLHSGKPMTERLPTYLTQITTKAVSVQSFAIDYAASTIDVTGQAPSFEEMNKYVDTLKFTTIDKGDGSKDTLKAFSQVVLASYSINEKGAGFSVKFNFDPIIFSSAQKNIKLVVPKITSTRSETERPSDLFKINETPVQTQEDQ